jgi:hypothetical protein
MVERDNDNNILGLCGILFQEVQSGWATHASFMGMTCEVSKP